MFMRDAGERNVMRCTEAEGELELLNTEYRSDEVADFERELRCRIVGQELAINALTELFQVYQAGMHTPGRPIGTLLFLGPTGSGKTRCVEAAAEALFGNIESVVKIDCAEMQHSHEISKLIGSPPGYLGHRETPPLLTQENLDRYHTHRAQLTFVLFDEIEKASDALWHLLLGILDKATLTLGDNRRVDFSRTIMVMTSNLGAREMSEITEGRLGFVNPPREITEQINNKIFKVGIEAARKKFAPEFFNRIDKVIVFHSLNEQALRQVLELELAAVQRRVLIAAKNRFVLRFSEAAKDFLLAHGYDQRYGARPLKRSIERHLIIPISNIVVTKQVSEGDIVHVDIDTTGKLVLRKQSYNSLLGTSRLRGERGLFGLRSAAA
ncbi:MAG: AAA family ATPase [Acidobacteriota bacterium]